MTRISDRPHTIVTRTPRLLPLVAVALLGGLLTGCPDAPLQVGGFCQSASDCPASQVCAGGMCVGTCVTSNDCGAGEVCKDQVCLPSCEVQAACEVAGGDLARLCLEGVCTPTERPGRPSAGEPRTVNEGDRVALSAGASTAYDAATTTYSWEQVASNPKGVVVTLEAGKADTVAGPDVAFTAPMVLQDTTFLFRLTMSDPDGNEAKAEVEIAVQNTINEAPVATAGADVEQAHAGDTITLSAAGSEDPNPFDDVTYAWTWALEPPAEGVDIPLTDASDVGDMSVVTFVAPELPVDTTLTFTLTVSDGKDTTTATVALLVWATVEPTCDPTLCDDEDDCTEDGCIPGEGCTHEPLTGTACDDGDLCTEQDTCADGVCAGAAKGCDDGDPCTDDACESGQCTTTVNKAPCNDGDPCTINDVCKLGTCGGAPKICDDGVFCTDDACVEGDCVATPNTLSCDDGNVCTLGDVCAAGACKGELKDCDDSNPCTNDGCQQGKCAHGNNSAPCEDGNQCTTDDTCTEGACKPGTPISCDDGNPCTTDACDPGLGCTTEPINAGPCDDGDPCTEKDQCTEAVCAGKPLSCDDDNPCTDDSCGATGCEHAANAAACDDGDPCTVGDVCAEEGCLSGEEPLVCDDGDPCTADACEAGVGCVTEPTPEAPCDDGDPCTLEDLCLDGGVCAGSPLVCDDGDVCTLDFCQDGACATAPAAGPCEDGNPCTIDDACAEGMCVGGKNPCDDGLACTADLCDPAQPGACLHPPAPVGTACQDDGGLCNNDGVCRHFEVRTFLPTQPVFPEVHARITGAMDDPFGGVAMSVAMEFATPDGNTQAGYVVNLAPGEPQTVAHQRFDGGFSAIADGIVAGTDVVSLRDADVWYEFYGFSELLAGQDVLAVAPAAPWYAGGAPSNWTIGLRSPDGTPVVVRCGVDVEGVCELAWQGVGPGQVDVLFGVWSSPLIVVEVAMMEPTPLLAVANGDDGFAQVAWVGPDNVWSPGAPFGCVPGEAGTPCEVPGRIEAAAGHGLDDLWLAGAGGRLLHFDGAAWTVVPLEGITGQPEAYALQALVRTDGHLWIAAEVPGCGAGPCVDDPTWKAHVLLHRADDGTWTPERLLAARQCPSADDEVACAAELALFTIEGAAAKADGTMALVGGDVVPQEATVWQELLAYLIRIEPPAILE